MSIIDITPASAFLEALGARRSARRLWPGAFPERLMEDLAEAARLVPSAFNAQPWRVVALRERNDVFWDALEATIAERLEGDRRERYLARTAGMRPGGMTLLIFEDLSLTAPRDNLTVEEARDQAAQSLGMLQLALWLTIAAHDLAASLQHWQFLMEDVALAFAGLPPDGFRLVAFMPIGCPADPPAPRSETATRFLLEGVSLTGHASGVTIETA